MINDWNCCRRTRIGCIFRWRRIGRPLVLRKTGLRNEGFHSLQGFCEVLVEFNARRTGWCSIFGEYENNIGIRQTVFEKWRFDLSLPWGDLVITAALSRWNVLGAVKLRMFIAEVDSDFAKDFYDWNSYGKQKFSHSDQFFTEIVISQLVPKFATMLC